MQIKQEAITANTAVLVGRFQVDKLHEGHYGILDWAIKNHKRVIVFLGLSPLKVTRNNPLDFEARKKMILEKFPTVTVNYIKDTVSDKVWSQKLDSLIGDILNPRDSVMLYGSRDSFIAHYNGRFKTAELEADVIISATEIREKISSEVKETDHFRAGVIWAAFNQYPTVLATVDLAIYDKDRNRILMGRKAHETLFRFVGGFSDPEKDNSFEAAALREMGEEVGLDVEVVRPPQYILSTLVDDWRFKKECNKIITSFFQVNYLYGAPTPKDDIAEVKWFDLDKAKETDFVPEHRALFQAFLKFNKIEVKE